MCEICGYQDLVHSKLDDHRHEPGEKVQIEVSVLEKNNHYALINRQHFKDQHILAINLTSSPGAGKTSLLAKTVADLHDKLNLSVIVGDQETHFDKEKIKANGGKVEQINTGKSCHLDANELGHFLKNLNAPKHSLLFIENIGNLVCPALFDLGENFRVVILSVTEGDNKPLKYPDMFKTADLLLITKTDLLPFVNFNVAKCLEYAKIVNPELQAIQISAAKNEGLDVWYDWLLTKFQAVDVVKSSEAIVSEE